MSEAPIIVLLGCPEDGSECNGKFLDLVWRGRQYLVFGAATAHRYHNRILGAFLVANGIPHHWASPHQLEVDGPDLAVLGGGRFHVAPAAGRLELWDTSQAYGGFDQGRLPAHIPVPGHPWSGLQVRVVGGR
jgi:hypothetical protein